MAGPRIFKTKWFQRFARKERIEDEALLEAAGRAEKGLIDANLGGGVIKQRIARRGEGKSGGYRTIIIFRQGDRAVFMYGFAKSKRADIRPGEEKEFKEAAKHILGLTDKQFAELLGRGDFVEVKRA
jgi:hypothetical protein